MTLISEKNRKKEVKNIKRRKGKMSKGKIIKTKEEIVKVDGREILIILNTYDTGMQRVISKFADRHRSFLVDRNLELTKKVAKLEAQLEEKNKK